ncbi:hypothetical protein BKP42_17770 [Rhodococcus erythropolis]|nr:hypothetical protein BKP42_17770 [Rhodococcus erythropolis]
MFEPAVTVTVVASVSTFTHSEIGSDPVALFAAVGIVDTLARWVVSVIETPGTRTPFFNDLIVHLLPAT